MDCEKENVGGVAPAVASVNNKNKTMKKWNTKDDDKIATYNRLSIAIDKMREVAACVENNVSELKEKSLSSSRIKKIWMK